MQAKRVRDAVAILAEHSLGKERVLETSCADFDEYSELPNVVRYFGRVYTKTGWNSDKGMAYYKTGNFYAVAV